jgi:hypothetical protein
MNSRRVVQLLFRGANLEWRADILDMSAAMSDPYG